MAKRSVSKAPASGSLQKEYQALKVAYGALLSGAGILRTAAVALESGTEDVTRVGVWETVQAAHTHLMRANDAFDSMLNSSVFEQVEAARAPLWDVLDLVFVAAHVLDDDKLPDQTETEFARRPSSAHPEAAPLRVAAKLAAGEGPFSVAAAVAQLQQHILSQRSAMEVAHEA